jgi:hypothetical protein
VSRDSRHLSDREKRIRYLMHDITDEQARELAGLAILLHNTYRNTMTTTARLALEEVLKSLGPDFLLTLRAMSEQASQFLSADPF